MGSSGMVDVVLSREGQNVPWGFRLHGGVDIGYPLVIQRVFVGTGSEGKVQRGDQLMQIQNRDTLGMTHRDAHDLIKAAGTRLQLLIRRLPGAPFTPTTPLTPDGMHPFAKLLRESEGGRGPPMPAPCFEPLNAPRTTPGSTPRATPLPPRDYCHSPILPTTPILDISTPPFFAPTPKSRLDAELIQYSKEKHQERNAITNQGYRTLPLIAPKPKARHDIPMGSYLRHCPDPNWKGRSTIQTSVPKFFTDMLTPTYSAIGHYRQEWPRRAKGPPPGAPTFERALNASEQLVHHQYNSPMFLYSQKNIADTIKEQTGVGATGAPKLNIPKASSPNPTGPLSPGATQGPVPPGTRLSNIVDITRSPTFQMLQETENRVASPLPRRKSPVSPGFAPGGGDTSFGTAREIIHQSGSFKNLMSNLYGPPVEEEAEE